MTRNDNVLDLNDIDTEVEAEIEKFKDEILDLESEIQELQKKQVKIINRAYKILSDDDEDFRVSYSKEKEIQEMFKYIKKLESTQTKIYSYSTSVEAKLEAIYNCYNKIHLLDLLNRALELESDDIDMQEKIMREVNHRMEWLIEND